MAINRITMVTNQSINVGTGILEPIIPIIEKKTVDKVTLYAAMRNA